MPNLTCSYNECDNPSRARGWCWPHYKQWHRGEDLHPVGWKKSPEQRFWEKVKKSDGCWEWQDSLSLGYGHISTRPGTKVPAHRFSYELANGPIPDGLFVDHICHNPACVRPEHLRAVTPKQNTEHRAGPQVNSKTGVRGVYIETATQKFIAVVNHNSKRHYVGSFHTLEEAAEAALAKRLELFTHNNVDRAAA